MNFSIFDHKVDKKLNWYTNAMKINAHNLENYNHRKLNQSCCFLSDKRFLNKLYGRWWYVDWLLSLYEGGR